MRPGIQQAQKKPARTFGSKRASDTEQACLKRISLYPPKELFNETVRLNTKRSAVVYLESTLK